MVAVGRSKRSFVFSTRRSTRKPACIQIQHQQPDRGMIFHTKTKHVESKQAYDATGNRQQTIDASPSITRANATFLPSRNERGANVI